MPDASWILETARLRLRCLTVDDAPFILRLVNEPSWLRFIGDRGVRTLEDARHYVERGPLETQRKVGFSLYLVTDKGTGESVGICGLLKRDTLPDADLGFAFLEAHQRKGYAYESAAAVMRHGIHALSLPRIVAVTTLDNEASAALLGKLGFRFERTIRPVADAPEVKLYAADVERWRTDPATPGPVS